MREPAREVGTSGNEAMASLLAGKGDVREVGVADLGVSIPLATLILDKFFTPNLGLYDLQHGIDSLAQLGRALLVDAHGIAPKIMNAVTAGLLACLHDLVVAGLPVDAVVPDVRALTLDGARGEQLLPLLEDDLLVAPGVRQDGVLLAGGLPGLEEEVGLGVDETHGDGGMYNGVDLVMWMWFWCLSGLWVEPENSWGRIIRTDEYIF